MYDIKQTKIPEASAKARKSSIPFSASTQRAVNIPDNDGAQMQEPANTGNPFMSLVKDFGFEDDTLRIMNDVYKKIREKNKDKSEKYIGWLFFRAMSQFYYFGFRGSWSAGAGFVGGDSKDELKSYFIGVLGLSTEDYNVLRGMINLQHIMASKAGEYDPEKEPFKIKGLDLENYVKCLNEMKLRLNIRDMTMEEYNGWYKIYRDKFSNKGDFAHMAYTIAAQLVEDDAPGVKGNESAAPVVNNLWRNHTTRRRIAGWLGDAGVSGRTKWQKFWGSGKTDFGPDDYIADLDAENIANRIISGSGVSVDQVISSYYEDLAKNEKIRVTEFLKHTSFETVKKAVLYRARVYSLPQLKRKWPDSWNFIVNLHFRNGTMKDYTKEKIDSRGIPVEP